MDPSKDQAALSEKDQINKNSPRIQMNRPGSGPVLKKASNNSDEGNNANSASIVASELDAKTQEPPVSQIQQD